MAGIESPHEYPKVSTVEQGPQELSGLPAPAAEVAGWTGALNAMAGGRGASMPQDFDRQGNNFTVTEAADEATATAARGSVPSTIGDNTAPVYDLSDYRVQAAILAAWPNSPHGFFGKNEFPQSTSNELDPHHSRYYDSGGHRHDTRQDLPVAQFKPSSRTEEYTHYFDTVQSQGMQIEDRHHLKASLSDHQYKILRDLATGFLSDNFKDFQAAALRFAAQSDSDKSRMSSLWNAMGRPVIGFNENSGGITFGDGLAKTGSLDVEAPSLLHPWGSVRPANDGSMDYASVEEIFKGLVHNH